MNHRGPAICLRDTIEENEGNAEKMIFFLKCCAKIVFDTMFLSEKSGSFEYFDGCRE